MMLEMQVSEKLSMLFSYVLDVAPELVFSRDTSWQLDKCQNIPLITDKVMDCIAEGIS